MFIRPTDRNDPRALIRRAVEAEFAALWRYCAILSGSRDDADDLAQRTCLRALERAGLFDPGSSVRAWLFTIARNLWRNELKARAVRRGVGTIPVNEAGLVHDCPSAEANIFTTEVLNRVGLLPDGQREAVLLVYAEGYSYREASEIMEIPIGTVMSRLAAARRKLAAAFPRERTRDVGR